MQKCNLDFYVIGAQKCATSWLFYCLEDHPEILIPEKKVEIGYIGGAMFKEKGEAWFFDRFKKTQTSRMMGDVSVDYLYDLNSAKILSEYSSNPKFVVSLRHPVDRMISSYYWLVRRGKLPNLPLEQGLRPLLDEPMGFEQRINSGLEEVVRRSCYATQLAEFLKVYPKENFMVILYDEIKAAPHECVKRVYAHIGVDPGFLPPSIHVRPKQNTYNKALLAFERIANVKVIAKISNLAHQALSRFSSADKKPDISPELYSALCHKFEPQVEAAKAVLRGLPSGNRPSDDVLDDLWSK